MFESNLAPGEDEVGSVAAENVEKMLIFSDYVVLPYDDMDSSTNEGDKESERHCALTDLVGVLFCRAIGVHLSKLDRSWDPHRLVPTQQTENKTDHEGKDTPIRVGQLPIEHLIEVNGHDG